MSDHTELQSKNRQEEIEEVTSKVLSFKPTKIAVEMVTENNKDLNNKYKQYKFNNYQFRNK